MKHDKDVRDYYQLPDHDDEESNQIQARFQRLAQKLRDESDIARSKFVRLASRQEGAVFVQRNPELFPTMSVPN
jgi:hypothetical protein